MGMDQYISVIPRGCNDNARTMFLEELWGDKEIIASMRNERELDAFIKDIAEPIYLTDRDYCYGYLITHEVIATIKDALKRKQLSSRIRAHQWNEYRDLYAFDDFFSLLARCEYLLNEYGHLVEIIYTENH